MIRSFQLNAFIYFFVVFFQTALVSLSHACGPWLPASYVSRNDDVFYAPPEVGFAAELRHLLPDSVPHEAVFAMGDEEALSAEQELGEALQAMDVSVAKRDETVKQYRVFRDQLNSAKRYLETPTLDYHAPPIDTEDRAAQLAALQQLTVPVGLPTEFELYLKGALDYYVSEISAAREHWQAVLELPKSERRYRSVMAAYMIARTSGHSAPEDYQRVRELATEGLVDSQGLAAASYGWEARYFLYGYGDYRHQSSINYKRAMDLYLKQWCAGYYNATLSLRITAREVWENASDSEIAELVQDAQSRAVLTAYLLTVLDEYSNENRRRLVNALPDPKALTVAEAGRFALLEYQQNELSAAKLWLSYADAGDALALWVRSKLLLREGKIDAGRVLMLALTSEMEKNGEDWRRLDTRRAWAELGLLMLGKSRYYEAAECFHHSASWEDEAYVLERLLDRGSLIQFARADRASKDSVTKDYYDDNTSVSSLVARRLMREGEFDAAIEFFDEAALQKAKAYRVAMQLASAPETNALMRAQYYWRAAQVMRNYGMQLFGTELEPDFAWFGGSLEWGATATERLEGYYYGYSSPSREISYVTDDEKLRLERSETRPNKRFHYRYRAIQLAELAAGLLPNDSDDAARIYVIAGSWVKLRDPQGANHLYKQLVVRCPHTELGMAAMKTNWFPKVDVDTIQPFGD
ncbi:MAG: hypothetical protein ABF322_04655 [Lentimonas sp.]